MARARRKCHDESLANAFADSWGTPCCLNAPSASPSLRSCSLALLACSSFCALKIGLAQRTMTGLERRGAAVLTGFAVAVVIFALVAGARFDACFVPMSAFGGKPDID